MILGIKDISLSRWHCLLGSFSLQVADHGIVLNNKSYNYPPLEQSASVRHGSLIITLQWGHKTVRFWKSVSINSALSTLLENRIEYFRTEYSEHFKQLENNSKKFSSWLSSQNRYMRSSHLNVLTAAFSSSNNLVKHESAFRQLGFQFSSDIAALRNCLSTPKQFQNQWNEEWKLQQLVDNKELFDTLEEHPLTERQRLACVTDEDNLLVLAGAGTGKTSTMIAKAKYVVANGYAKPGEIMMLAFGKDAKLELQERADEHTELKGLKISTFHSTGKEIINFHEDNIVSRLATDERVYEKFVETQIQELLKNEEEGTRFSEFVTQYLYPKPSELAFKKQSEYLQYVKNNELRALSGDLVKSFEELTIANYLYTNGIRFEYEKAYPFDVSDPSRGLYQPDFYLPDLNVYLEHFGVNKQGETRPDIDAKIYNEEMDWKRDVHRRCNTVLWETFSWHSQEKGGLVFVLERYLQQHCSKHSIELSSIMVPVNPVDIYNRLNDLGLVSRFARLIANFLTLFKSSPQGLDAIRYGETDEYNFTRWELFKKLFSWVYNRYQAVLEANKSIDFSDMINKATLYAEKPDFHSKTKGAYKIKYLLVDEFQDISPIRAEFIKAIRNANSDCTLMGVGDDWQAIYQFTGSDVKLTTEFEKNFGASEVLYLDKTFRFNNRIEAVASRFVQANPTQISKKLTTHSVSFNPEVFIVVHPKDEAIAKVMDSLGEPPEGKKPSILLLSRFKKSLPELAELKRKYPGYSFKAMSAHGSKGKQADYVIILDVIDDTWGFPSKVETDSILLTLLPQADTFKHAEERRLFYVALSRAKQTVFVHTEVGRESVFVKELKEYKEDVRLFLCDLTKAFVEHARCPTCLEGSLVPIVGKHGLFYACSMGKHYCKTVIRACPACGFAPVVPKGTHYECESEQCGQKYELCTSCGNGMLIKRVNSNNGNEFWGCTNYRGEESNSCRYSRRVNMQYQTEV